MVMSNNRSNYGKLFVTPFSKLYFHSFQRQAKLLIVLIFPFVVECRTMSFQNTFDTKIFLWRLSNLSKVRISRSTPPFLFFFFLMGLFSNSFLKTNQYRFPPSFHSLRVSFVPFVIFTLFP